MKKISLLQMNSFWVQKWCIFMTLDHCKNFFKFCSMKSFNRYMKTILMISQKNYCLGQMAPKMAHPNNSGSTLRIFFKFWTLKGTNRQMKVILIVFTKVCFWGGKWVILSPKIAHPQNSELALIVFF